LFVLFLVNIQDEPPFTASPLPTLWQALEKDYEMGFHFMSQRYAFFFKDARVSFIPGRKRLVDKA
jgi:hypothetical protein